MNRDVCTMPKAEVTNNTCASRWICGTAWVLVLVAGAASADVIYVDDSTAGGAHDGTSWVDAFTDLHCALAIAQAGDEIRIAQGVYKPTGPGGPRDASFHLVNGVTLQGGYAGFGADDPDALDWEKFATILGGDLNGDDVIPMHGQFLNNGENIYSVVIADGVGPETSLRGLIVKGGNASASDPPNRAGGGLRCINGASLHSPTARSSTTSPTTAAA